LGLSYRHLTKDKNDIEPEVISSIHNAIKPTGKATLYNIGQGIRSLLQALAAINKAYAFSQIEVPRYRLPATCLLTPIEAMKTHHSSAVAPLNMPQVSYLPFSYCNRFPSK